jgi:hypothetical protein
MKKSLIALAVVAISGAASAQVTITGSVAAGYKQSSVSGAAGTGTEATKNKLLAGVADSFVGGSGGNATGDNSGLGLDTTTVTFAASEDLGGGMKVDASMNIDTLNRKEVAGGDSSLKLTTSVGRFTVQTYRPVDYLSAGISGVGGAALDDRVFSARVNRDAVGFDTKLGPVFIGVSFLEAGKSKTSTTTDVGLGAGSAGAAGTTGQRLNSYSVTYVGGPLIANLNYLTYDSMGTTDAGYKDVIRTAASYNLGFVKLGGGYSVTTTAAGGTVKDALVAASIPAGNWTFGANYGMGTVDGTSIARSAAGQALIANGTAAAAVPATLNALGINADSLNGTRSGYSLTAGYAISKRTALTASYVNWLSSPFAANRNNEATLLLSHSF